MTARVFVDTNVLIYRSDTSDPARQAMATAWLEVLWSENAGRTSFQVLQEFYRVSGRVTGMTSEERRAVARSLLA